MHICTEYRCFPKFFLGRSLARLGDRTGIFTPPDRFLVAMDDWASPSLYPCYGLSQEDFKRFPSSILCKIVCALGRAQI